MLAALMDKTLIDVDQSRTRYDYITTNVEGSNDLTNSTRGFGTPPCLHHIGRTMEASSWPKPSPRQLEDLRRLSSW
jgi:hypothetical protein